MKSTANSLLVLLLVIASTATAQQPCNSGPPAKAVIDWPEFRFDLCHTGYNPYEFVLTPATVGNLVLDWKYTTGARSSLLRRQSLTVWCTPVPMTKTSTP